MSCHEVSQTPYAKVMGKSRIHFSDPKNPVDGVSWDAATEFCRRLSQSEGNRYRRSTEAEWEYACRAGSATPFYTGTALYTTQANFGQKHGRPRPGGGFLPNAFGLYDMSGNLWEWRQDWYGEKYYASSPAPDPPGPGAGQARVLRGGSWKYDSNYARGAHRDFGGPGDASHDFGLRVVCAPGP